MKKKINQLISACLLFGTLVSCSSEDALEKNTLNTGISLELKTTGQTRSSVEPGTEAERQISSASVWFFRTGAGDGDNALFYKKITASSSTSSLILKFTDEELRLHHMTSEGVYEIFVVANLPADASIDEQTTLANLKGHSYTATTRPGSPFCMTGNSVGVHDFGKNSQLSIPLLRAASRLDITVKNATGKSWSINKISIAEDQKSVLLFAPVTGSAAPASDAFKTAQDILTTATTNDEVTCSGYIYENRSTSSVKVIIEGTVDGTAKTWTSELKPNGSATLPRNTICGVTLNLKESEPVVPTGISFTIKDWTTESLNTKLHATYLELDQTSVNVQYILGAVMGVKSDAATIHIDWSEAPGFYLSDHESDTDATVTLIEENTFLEFHSRGESNDVIPAGTVTVTAGNLSQRVSIVTVKNNILFHVKSIEINGHTISDGDIIPGDLWGSTKDELVSIVATTNLRWAFRMKGYVPSLDFDLFVVEDNSDYNGVVGNSSPNNPNSIKMTNIEMAGLTEYLPVHVTIDFFLNTFVPAEDPTKLHTIHFTINN